MSHETDQTIPVTECDLVTDSAPYTIEPGPLLCESQFNLTKAKAATTDRYRGTQDPDKTTKISDNKTTASVNKNIVSAESADAKGARMTTSVDTPGPSIPQQMSESSMLKATQDLLLLQQQQQFHLQQQLQLQQQQLLLHQQFSNFGLSSSLEQKVDQHTVNQVSFIRPTSSTSSSSEAFQQYNVEKTGQMYPCQNEAQPRQHIQLQSTQEMSLRHTDKQTNTASAQATITNYTSAQTVNVGAGCRTHIHTDTVTQKVKVVDLERKRFLEHCKEVTGKDSSVYIKTEAHHIISNCLETRRHVTITGSPGSGKTSIAYQLLREYVSDGYDALIVKHPWELKRYRDPSQPTVVLIDDIFGVSALSPTLLQTWKEAIEEFEPALGYSGKSDGKLKLIITSRSYIIKEATDNLGFLCSTLFDENTVTDLISETVLTEEEKFRIFESHRKENGIEMSECLVRKICRINPPHGFPHTCCLFFKLRQFHKNPLRFFSSPLPCLQECLRTLASSDPVKFVTLLLVLLHGGKLDIASLDVDNPHLQEAASLFQSVTPKDIAGNAYSVVSHLCGTFLRRESDTVSFSHPSVMDTVAYILGNRNPKFIIESCSCEFLFERVKIHISEREESEKGTHEDKQMFHIVLSKQWHQALAARFAKELAQGYFALVCSHQAMSVPVFVQRCFDILDKDARRMTKVQDRDYGESLLFWAMWSKSSTLCEYLIPLYKFNEEALLKAAMCCCFSGNTAALKHLIQNTNKEVYRNFKVGRFQDIATLSHSDEKLITKKWEINTSRDTLIHKACEQGQAGIVSLLLEIGFSIKEVNRDHQTLLHQSCKSNSIRLTQYLLSKGADVNAPNKKGNLPIHTAARCGNESQVRTLIHFCGKENRCLDLEVRNPWGVTPLMWACREGHYKVAELLLKHNADINAVSNKGNTPLMWACGKGHGKVADLLLELGANVNASNSFGDTALMMSCKEGPVSAVKNLILHHAEIDSDNIMGNTPLMWACMWFSGDQLGIVEYILSRHANVHRRNKDGDTPLILASREGFTNVVTVLISRAADVNAVNNKGDTALITASYKGHGDVVKVLLTSGADASVTNNSGINSVVAARSRGHDSVLDMLSQH